MEKLVIMDYSTCTVHIHPLDREDPITDELIDDLGYCSSDCYWMAGDVEFKTHNKEVVR